MERVNEDLWRALQLSTWALGGLSKPDRQALPKLTMKASPSPHTAPSYLQCGHPRFLHSPGHLPGSCPSLVWEAPTLPPYSFCNGQLKPMLLQEVLPASLSSGSYQGKQSPYHTAQHPFVIPPGNNQVIRSANIFFANIFSAPPPLLPTPDHQSQYSWNYVKTWVVMVYQPVCHDV